MTTGFVWPKGFFKGMSEKEKQTFLRKAMGSQSSMASDAMTVGLLVAMAVVLIAFLLL